MSKIWDTYFSVITVGTLISWIMLFLGFFDFLGDMGFFFVSIIIHVLLMIIFIVFYVGENESNRK